jgi:hypothetical protein
VEVSGQFHALAALLPRGDPPVTTAYEARYGVSMTTSNHIIPKYKEFDLDFDPQFVETDI